MNDWKDRVILWFAKPQINATILERDQDAFLHNQSMQLHMRLYNQITYNYQLRTIIKYEYN